MSDFFNKAKGAEAETEEEVLPIKIGDAEYTAEELEGLVADGKFKREVESKQNTKLDKVFGEYTKLTQDKSNWDKEREDYLRIKGEIDNAANKQPAQFDEATISKAQEEARKLGLFTKTEVEKYVSENFPKFYSQQREADRMLEKMEGLEKEIDGSDGRPKFVLDEVLNHIRATGIKDPMKAYKDKYETELDSWKEKKLYNSKREGIYSESGSTAGGKNPPVVRPTKENLGQLVREALNGS